MVKHTIEISREPVLLSAKLDQLVIQPFDQPKTTARSIPCEDIGVVLVDQPRTSYTHGALQALAKFGAVVVICGRDHLPAGMLLPVSNHSELVHRMHEQIAVTQPVKKRLWQQIVRAKINAQARNLAADSTARGRLHELTKEIRSGDPTNVEAQAARVYWSAWLGPESKSFRRKTDGGDPINAMLNYGYAILRAAVARALIGAGLQPALGIHHCNRSNAFCLADDLIEPLRPMIDRRVRGLHRDGRKELDQPTKARLLDVLTEKVQIDQQNGPLMVALHKTTASLTRCFQGLDKKLLVPVPQETDA